MRVFINDEPKDLPEKQDLASFAENLGIGDQKGWAFAVNVTIVPKAKLRDKVLTDGDRILMIQATQGG